MFGSRCRSMTALSGGLLRTLRASIDSTPAIIPLVADQIKLKWCRLYADFVPFKCWNCQTVLDAKPSLFCNSCSLIQSSDQQNFNYFELFNVDQQFNIDTGQLTTNFRKLQSLTHPDKFSNKTEVKFSSLTYQSAFDHVIIKVDIIYCFRKRKFYQNHFLPF